MHTTTVPNLSSLLKVLGAAGVTDLVVNGPADWRVNRGAGFQPIDGLLGAQQQPASALAELARQFVDLADRHLDLANPVCDVSLTPGQLPELAAAGIESLRVHAVLESAISAQTLLSIRVHRAGFHSLERLGEEGMFTAAQGAKLAQLMAEQQNFLIAGPAGAGKTTLLRALLAQDPERRTVVVEDTAELLPMPGHVVGLQARQANIDGRGAITLDALAQQALRMQPQRLVIGEVRGSEVMVLLQSMNTGHAGSAATIHANSPQTVYPRLRGLAQSAGASDSAFQLLAQSAIQKVIFLGGPQGELGGSGLGNRVQRRVQWIGSLQW